MNSCPACKKENPKIAIFCETCNYPFEGTEKEKAIHIGRFVTKKGVTVDSEIQINRSRSPKHQVINSFFGFSTILFLYFRKCRGLLTLVYNNLITPTRYFLRVDI